MFPKNALSSKSRAFERLILEFIFAKHDIEKFIDIGGDEQEEREKEGDISSVSWQYLEDLLDRKEVMSICNSLSKILGDLATTYSSTIASSKAQCTLQFHEFSKFLNEIKPKSLPITSHEVCRIFIRCCRKELSTHFSEYATLATCAVSFASNNKDSSNGFEHSARGLDISCAKMIHPFAIIALLVMPRLLKLKGNDRIYFFSSSRLVITSIMSLMQCIAFHLSPRYIRRIEQSHDKGAAFAKAAFSFVQEFGKLHRADNLDDYMVRCAQYMREIKQNLKKSESNEIERNQKTENAEEYHNDYQNVIFDLDAEEVVVLLREEQSEDLDSQNLHGPEEIDDDEEEENESDPPRMKEVKCSPSPSTSSPRATIRTQEEELNTAVTWMNEADGVYSQILDDMEKLMLSTVKEASTNEKSTNQSCILDNWIAAGQKCMRAIQWCSSEVNRATLHLRFGISLFVFAIQIIKSNTKVYKYEELFHITNTRVYTTKSDLWGNGTASSQEVQQHVSFALALAMETLALGLTKFSSATNEFADIVQDVGRNEDIKSNCYEKYLEGIFHGANCLSTYGDLLAHGNCLVDYDLGYQLEEEQERAPASSISAQNKFYQNGVLTKASTAGQIYNEAQKMYQFLLKKMPSHHLIRQKIISIHHHLSMAQFKLATHLPRGCLAGKRLLDEALQNLQICQTNKPQDIVFSKKHEYISAILVLRHKFFQTVNNVSSTSTSTSTSGSTSSAASSSAKNINKRRTSRETGAPNEDEAINAIAPFYRFILAAAFRDLDKEKTNSLSIASLNTLNMECGQQRISSSAMNWFLHNFDQENGGLTEKGLLEYFCWIAEADPVTFCCILDILTAKYTETNEMSITSTMATGTSLKNTLFYQRKFGPTMSLSTSSSSHRESLSAFESTGLAECVVVLSGKMTPESCRSLCNTTGPSDIRLEAEIVDLLPSNAVVPDELSKFCFPEGIFLHDELLPPRTFDMVLTDIKGQRLFASCLHFYEEKDPIEVLALISNVQKGKSLSLPPWISLKDIQQRKSKWKCFVPKSLCVISIYPLYQTFREFLAQLYRLSISTPGASNPSPASSPTHAGSVSSASAAITVSAPLPIESYIFNFLNQVPMPKTSQTQTCFSIADRVYLLRGNSSSSSFYPTEVDFSLLFQCLSIENILKVYTYILTEKKVGLCAENNSILTPVAETLRALLCPFECQMVYIPVLPLALFEFMSAPVPFLMGIQTDKTEVEVLTREGVIVVDLDKNEVHVPRQEPLPTLPEHKVKKFIPTLKKVCSWASSQRTKDSYGSFRTGELCEVTFFEGTAQPSEVDLQLLTRHNDEIMEKWTEIQTLFTSFAHAVILKDYRKFCHKRISTSDGTETIIFDRKGYISMHPSLREFGPHFFQTQMFQRFLEYGPSGGINENLAAHPLMLSDSESFIGRTIRYKSTIRKDSIDEPGRNNFRRTITAPLPMKGAFRSPSLQSSVQRYGLQQFQPFNAEVYEEFHAQPSNLVSSGEIHSSLLASTNFLIPSANSLMADEDSTPPVQTQPMRLSRVLGSPSSTSSSPNTSNRDSEASQLISAARMRLEIATKETETISSNKSPEKDQRSSQQLNVLVPY